MFDSKKLSVSAVALMLIAISNTAFADPERQKSSSEQPNPELFTIAEMNVTYEGVRSGYWDRVLIAVPKSINCREYSSDRKTNCFPYVRLSAIDHRTTDRQSSTVTVPISISGGGSYQGTYNQFSLTTVASLGSRWREEQISFEMPQSGIVNLNLNSFCSQCKVTFTPVPIQVTVKSQAEVEAERAAEEEARKKRAAENQAKEEAKQKAYEEEARKNAREEAAANKAAAERAKRNAANKAANEKKILSTKLTITCKNGSTTRKVSGDPPACPNGMSNSMSSFKTFQAYSKCKLYKKQWGTSSVSLRDNGKTLIFDAWGLGNEKIDASYSDLSCALNAMGAPASVWNKMKITRALDGMVEAKFGGVSAFWNYHPNSGLNATFTH